MHSQLGSFIIIRRVGKWKSSKKCHRLIIQNFSKILNKRRGKSIIIQWKRKNFWNDRYFGLYWISLQRLKVNQIFTNPVNIQSYYDWLVERYQKRNK